MNKFIYTTALILICINTASASQFDEAKIKSKIYNEFKGYDSVIFFNRTASWIYDNFYWGIGYKKNNIYQLICKFQFVDRNGKESGLKIDRIQKSDITIWYKDSLSLSRLGKLNRDSLQSEPREKGTRRISGGDEYRLIIITSKGEYAYKYAYMPDYYQKLIANDDRAVFLEAKSIFKRLFYLNWNE